MRTPRYKAIILVSALALICTAGCNKAQTPSGKKCRLVAAENIDLKKQITQKDRQIDDLKARYTVRVKLEQSKLAECQKKVEDCKTELGEKLDKKVADVLAATMEEIVKLRTENETLKAQLAELKPD